MIRVIPTGANDISSGTTQLLSGWRFAIYNWRLTTDDKKLLLQCVRLVKEDG